MTKRIVPFLLLSACFCGVFCQSDRQLIEQTLEGFIEGTTYNYPEKIRDAFYPNTPMFLYNEADSVWVVSSDTYAGWYGRRSPGVQNKRYSSILSIDIVGTVASAKLQVDIPSFGNRYYDLMLLKKIEGAWKITSKSTSAEPIPKKPADMVPNPVKKVVMEGFARPWSMAFISEHEAVVAEKDGDVLLVNIQEKSRKRLRGLPSDVGRKIVIDTAKFPFGVFPSRAHGQKRSFNVGWFQVLLDPNFEENRYLYLSYASEDAARASTTKVVRGQLLGDRLQQVETLFVAEPYTHGLFHYGGGMIFGEDEKLYITIGERNLYEHLNPPLPLSQDVTDKRGKVIRISRDGSIPSDNPDFGDAAIPGLYAMGIRAAQGLALQPGTSTIWFSEHGTIQGDELNVLKPGANYGWPYETSGGYRSENYAPEVPQGLVMEDPVYFWEQTVAPTGICFYTGQAFPQWQGNLLVPGLSKGSLWRMGIKEHQVVSAEQLFVDDRVRLRKVVQSPGGVLYLLTDEENGKIIQLSNASEH